MTRKIRMATDIGGTFTDLVYYEVDPETGAIEAAKTAKTQSTPPDFEAGVMDALEKEDVEVRDVEFFAHGTTVVINALTERKGVRTGLITTRGFRDVLEIGRGNRPDFFNLRYSKPAPFVPRFLTEGNHREGHPFRRRTHTARCRRARRDSRNTPARRCRSDCGMSVACLREPVPRAAS